jgi:RNA polymerase sigma factor (sigma-70 family)
MAYERGSEPEDAEYDAFFDECLPIVIGMVGRLTGSRTEAEDVAVDAMGRAYMHWAKVGSLPYRRAWVLRVAINITIGRSRRRRPLAPPEQQRPDVADAVVLREALMAALAKLPRRQREAVGLRYLVDLSETEAAAVMGVSAGSVKTHLSRGLTGLRRVLGPDIDAGGGLDVLRG